MISHNYLTPQFFFYKNINSHILATYGFKTFPSEARALELGWFHSWVFERDQLTKTELLQYFFLKKVLKL